MTLTFPANSTGEIESSFEISMHTEEDKASCATVGSAATKQTKKSLTTVGNTIIYGLFVELSHTHSISAHVALS